MESENLHEQSELFHGGHDPECWREDLRSALPWAFCDPMRVGVTPQ
jgi:enterochelin esterase-like enzyme